MIKENKKMPDKTIYPALFSQPSNPTTDITAQFNLGVSNSPYKFPLDAVVHSQLDGGPVVDTPVTDFRKAGRFLLTYDNLALGQHTLHMNVTGTNMDEGYFDIVWVVVAP